MTTLILGAVLAAAGVVSLVRADRTVRALLAEADR